jgi:ABC-type uncharacterized transport system auxiliary subunit
MTANSLRIPSDDFPFGETARSGAIRLSLLGIFSLLLLAGISCGKALPVHYYDFRYPAPAALFPTPKLKATLAVAPYTAPFSYRQNRLLYREGPQEAKVAFYEDRRWASAPTELITLAIVPHLRQSGLFEKVILEQGDTPADYLLRGKIVALDEVDKADGYYAQVGLEVELFRLGDGRKLLWTETIQHQRKTTVRDPDAIANELALAVGEALQILASKLSTVL